MDELWLTWPEFIKHVAEHNTLTPFFDSVCRDLGHV